MAKTRKNARARNTNLRVIENDPAALAAERANDATAIDPTTPDAPVELAPGEGQEWEQLAPEVEGEVADKIVETHYATTLEGAAVEIEERALAHSEPAIAAEVAATEQAQEPAPEPAAPVTDVTDGGRLLASRFPDANEALAYAGNMKLRNYSISRQDDGQYAIEVRKQASAKPAAQTTEGAVQAPARAAPKARTPRAKASGPRPDTRNAVIWSMLTRPEGTTKKEVDAALAAFQPNNIQPCGIGSDAKLFSGRFGYDWKKTSDADGATRYFCFPFAPVESEVEVEVVVPSEVEGEPKVETESAAS